MRRGSQTHVYCSAQTHPEMQVLGEDRSVAVHSNWNVNCPICAQPASSSAKMNVGSTVNIVAAAKLHAKLLSTIQDLEYVPRAKQDRMVRLMELRRDIESQEKKLESLAETTKKEKKEYELLRDSASRRLSYVIPGQKEKYTQQKRRYEEASERETTEKNDQNILVHMHDEENRELAGLVAREKKYKSAHSTLQALYDQTGYDGATGEDVRLEYEVHVATKRHDDALEIAIAERRASELITQATKAMGLSHQHAREAYNSSKPDGGIVGDVRARSALQHAQEYATKAETLFEQARQFIHEIKPIPLVHIPKGISLLGGIVGNIFTDTAFHSKITESASQARVASERLKAERDASGKRKNAAAARLVTASKDLETRRRDLFSFRKLNFEGYLAQSSTSRNFNGKIGMIGDASDSGFLEMVEGLSTTTQRQEFSSGSSPMVEQNSTEQAMAASIIQGTSDSWGSKNPFAFALCERTCG